MENAALSSVLKAAFVRFSIFMSLCFFAGIARAELTEAQRGEYQISLETGSAKSVAIEISKHSALASWHCGFDIVRQLKSDLENGRELQIPSNASPDCRSESEYMQLAWKAGALKSGRAALGDSKVPATTRQYTFSMRIPEINKTGETMTGNGFCLDEAKKLFAEWRKSESLPFGKLAELKSGLSLNCTITRAGADSQARFSCDRWLMSSEYDFATREVFLKTNSVPRYSPEEIQAMKKNMENYQERKRKNQEPTIEELTQNLRFEINAGVYFLASISTRAESNRGTFEIRGIEGDEWARSVYGYQGAAQQRIADIQPACSIKTDIDVEVGKIELKEVRSTR